MITVELEPEELHILIKVLTRALNKAAVLGSQVVDMKAMLARIEYLEGLK